MNWAQMAICEAASDELVKEVVNKMQEHVRDTPGMLSHSVLVEEGGRMVILITDWPNRQMSQRFEERSETERLTV